MCAALRPLDEHRIRTIAIEHRPVEHAFHRRPPEDAERERHAASAELRQRIKDALADGVSPTLIGQEARLSHQAVYEARDQL